MRRLRRHLAKFFRKPVLVDDFASRFTYVLSNWKTFTSHCWNGCENCGENNNITKNVPHHKYPFNFNLQIKLNPCFDRTSITIITLNNYRPEKKDILYPILHCSLSLGTRLFPYCHKVQGIISQHKMMNKSHQNMSRNDCKQSPSQ